MKRFLFILMALGFMATPVLAEDNVYVVTMGGPHWDAMGVSLIPKTDNTYDIGSSTKEWKDLYIDGTGYIDNIEVGGDDDIGTIDIHDAGTITFRDDSDDTTVVIGPVANGTTTLGITGDVSITSDMTVSGGDLILGTSAVGGNITQHDAGITTYYDDGDNTTVIIGPVTDGTTTLGITGGLDISGDSTGNTFTADPAVEPSVKFYDSQATAGDINAKIYADATDVGDGTEDVDVFFQQQIAGTLTTFFHADADGSLDFNDRAIAVVRSDVTVLTPNTTTAVPTTYANDTTVACTYSLMRIAGDGGPVVLDTDPAIADGTYDGQTLTLEGCHDTNTVTIADACNTALSGNVNFTLGLRDVLELFWNAGQSIWVERSRSDN